MLPLLWRLQRTRCPGSRMSTRASNVLTKAAPSSLRTFGCSSMVFLSLEDIVLFSPEPLPKAILSPVPLIERQHGVLLLTATASLHPFLPPKLPALDHLCRQSPSWCSQTSTSGPLPLRFQPLRVVTFSNIDPSTVSVIKVFYVNYSYNT